MPSCLSTGVKLGRRLCWCASRGVVAEETRNSIKEEPASSMQRRPSKAMRRSGTSKRRRRIAVARWSAKQGSRESAEHGAAEPCWWPMAANVWGQRRRQTEPAAEEKRGEQRRRRREDARKQRAAGESRSTSTMKVDDDGDGGGEACAAAGIVRRRRRPNFVFAERGSRRMGCWILPLFWVATDQRQTMSVADLSRSIMQIGDISILVAQRSSRDFATHRDRLVSVADLSQICHNLGGKFMAGEINDRSVTKYNLSQFLSQIILSNCCFSGQPSQTDYLDAKLAIRFVVV
ncbi:hypothetical protein Scep_011595 [Stephania cephalantha]|uniref:Uncharacterized protein n=1 Tax=Stephania cephalantha TaxID=152367 RepID=A0AAP0P5Q2_9MAGN